MKKVIVSFAVIILAAFFAACEGQNIETQSPTEGTEEAETAAVDEIDKIMDGMTLDEKIYQLFFVKHDSLVGVTATMSGEATKEALSEMPVGGIIYFSANVKSAEQMKNMIEKAQSYSKIPLFVGVDEEGGKVSRLKKAGITRIPPMGELKTEEEAQNAGRTLGKELKELGFNVDFAPVADVLVNSENSEIGDRSFGSDAEKVSEMVGAFVPAIEGEGVSAVLKHFPGHGSTSANSHTGYSESKRTLSELRECEFKAFGAGIEAGADFVMVSHMTAVNAVKSRLPSSLSKEIITDLLKGELGFEGIVITDALDMGAVTDSYSSGDAAVMAVEAGADMLLMPENLGEAHEAILSAVKSGRITPKRIDESVRKILTQKYGKYRR